MKAITYTAARENLAATMQRVCEDRAPVVITRRRDQAVVMIALADYEAIEETAYLLRSPRNAARLREAVDQLREGRGTERKLPVLG
jgi:antitoxin YefM